MNESLNETYFCYPVTGIFRKSVSRVHGPAREHRHRRTDDIIIVVCVCAHYIIKFPSNRGVSIYRERKRGKTLESRMKYYKMSIYLLI